MPTVDTLKLKTRLSESGMPEAQAQVLVEELDEALSIAISREAATKADVVELRALIHGLDERLHGLDERLSEFKTDNAKQLEALRVDTGKQFDAFRTETDKQFDALRADTDKQFDALRIETDKQFQAFRTDFDALRTDTGKQLDVLKTDAVSMKTEIHDIKGELKLLRWMIGATLTIAIGIGVRILFM